jgi:GntR family transcriptional regulator
MVSTRIDQYAVTPKYHQLYTILKNQIESGEFAPHQAIPSEREMETLYSVSRTTIRLALTLLINQGYVFREHGKGTFVAPPKLQNSLHVLTSFTGDMQERGMKPGQVILEMRYVEPSAKVRQNLDLAPSISQVFMIQRLRLADDRPVGIHTAYLPLRPDQTITEAEMEAAGSLYALLEEKFNIYPFEADETIEATIADAHEAALLEVNEGSPLLRIERIAWSQARETMEYVRVLYRADMYQYYVHLSR